MHAHACTRVPVGQSCPPYLLVHPLPLVCREQAGDLAAVQHVVHVLHKRLVHNVVVGEQEGHMPALHTRNPVGVQPIKSALATPMSRAQSWLPNLKLNLRGA